MSGNRFAVAFTHIFALPPSHSLSIGIIATALAGQNVTLRRRHTVIATIMTIFFNHVSYLALNMATKSSDHRKEILQTDSPAH